MRGDESINQHFTGTKECLSRSISKAKHDLKNNIYTLRKRPDYIPYRLTILGLQNARYKK